MSKSKTFTKIRVQKCNQCPSQKRLPKSESKNVSKSKASSKLSPQSTSPKPPPNHSPHQKDKNHPGQYILWAGVCHLLQRFFVRSEQNMDQWGMATLLSQKTLLATLQSLLPSAQAEATEWFILAHTLREQGKHDIVWYSMWMFTQYCWSPHVQCQVRKLLPRARAHLLTLDSSFPSQYYQLETMSSDTSVYRGFFFKFKPQQERSPL